MKSVFTKLRGKSKRVTRCAVLQSYLFLDLQLHTKYEKFVIP